MRDYKRLTERDEFGNADIIGVGSEILTCVLDFDELNKLTFALNKFADLEDKIESGEIVDRNEYLDRFMSAKGISRLTDKEIEFFAKHNARVRGNADAEITRLTAENAELKARLENAVELPCQYGDEIYSILNFGKESIVLKGKCERVMYEKSASVSRTTVWGVFEDEWQLHPYTFTNESLKFIFKTRKEAEAHLAELKGGRE